jgi:Tol biopolymer transport system component
LYAYDVKTHRRRLLAPRASTFAGAPGSTSIAYVVRREPAGRGLYLVRADGTHRMRLTADPTADEPVWSPDGRYLFWYSGQGEERLHVARADGSGVHDLGRVFQAGAAWLPS